jgi:hypothetical protein
MRTSCAAIVALLACAATAAPDAASGSATGGIRAPGPDLASGGVVAPDPAPDKSTPPRRRTEKRAPPPATAPAPSAPAPSQTRTVVATTAVAKRASHRRGKQQRRHHRQHPSEDRVARAGPVARIVSLPARRLVSQATDPRGSDGRLLRAALALFLVALAACSLLLRVATQLPRQAR